MSTCPRSAVDAPPDPEPGGGGVPAGKQSLPERLLAAARNTAGQATAEYALVMLAAAGLAGLLLAWATSTDGVARLMDAVLDSLIGDVRS